MRIAPTIKLTPRSAVAPGIPSTRSHVVLLAARGNQDKEIAHTLHTTPQKVSRCRKRFLRLGLKEKPPLPRLPSKEGP